jgi:tetratricopeptide (TPR) repeat protein
MKSLYGLLGAGEGDDADALRKAFRRAVKAHHPDLHPGDPDAPERFRQIIAAHGLLRDAKQRATYDRLLLLERQQFQLKLECDHLRSNLAQQQVRLKRMRITAAAAALGALLGVYGLVSHKSIPTAIVPIDKEGLAAAAGATAKKDGQTASAIVAAEKNQKAQRAAGGPRSDVVKGNLESNAENAGKAVETTGAEVLPPTDALAHGEHANTHEDAELANAASAPAAGNRDEAEVASQASKTHAVAIESGDAQGNAGREPTATRHANDGNFYKQRGIAAYRAGDFLGAISNFDEAIRLNPDDAQSYNIRGNVWDELGILERALADYEEAIRLDPNSPAVFRDRAILWQRQGALDKALVDLDRAIRFSFTDANLYCDRGLIWYQKGRRERAIADFDRAIKLDPNFAAAYINRGLILHANSAFNVAFADSKAIRVDRGIFDVIRHMNSPYERSTPLPAARNVPPSDRGVDARVR